MADPNSVEQIITDALIILGVIADDEVPTASQAQRGLRLLNDMFDAWSADRITVFTVQEYVFPLGSAQKYTIGPGGDFDMPFTPLIIEEAYCQVTSTNPTSEVPIRIVEAQEWSQITVKNTPSQIPRTMWFDRQWPLSNLSFFPIPQGQNNVALYCWQELSNFSNLSSNIVLPPGYKLAVKYGLAETMAPFYGVPITNEIKYNSDKYKQIVARRNLPNDQMMQCDLGTLSPSKTYNWLTGEAR